MFLLFFLRQPTLRSDVLYKWTQRRRNSGRNVVRSGCLWFLHKPFQITRALSHCGSVLCFIFVYLCVCVYGLCCTIAPVTQGRSCETSLIPVLRGGYTLGYDLRISTGTFIKFSESEISVSAFPVWLKAFSS